MVTLVFPSLTLPSSALQNLNEENDWNNIKLENVGYNQRSMTALQAHIDSIDQERSSPKTDEEKRMKFLEIVRGHDEMFKKATASTRWRSASPKLRRMDRRYRMAIKALQDPLACSVDYQRFPKHQVGPPQHYQRFPKHQVGPPQHMYGLLLYRYSRSPIDRNSAPRPSQRFSKSGTVAGRPASFFY